MEIISELEPVARGPYCGAIGFLGFGGDMDTSVSIRIAVAAGGRIAFHAGGAVVADSDPGAEYAETLDKARALLEIIGGGHR
jgi:anthranilate/para-aminobenzoate synthase component I